MNLDLKFYWELLLKRLPVMLALFLVCAISASVSALKLPPTYSTSAQLLVEEAQIPDNMIQISQVDPNQQLQVIEQRLTTRANLLDIAHKHDVFENMRSMNPDEIVEGMRQQTLIRRTGGRGQATLMSVSFEARYAEIAANVVNEYVTLILQESTDFRMRRAENTLEFFEQEVERLGTDLDLQSSEIVSFKNENSTALPSDLLYRQNRQTLLQERQSRLEREISTIQQQRDDIVRVFETTGQLNRPDNTPLSPEAQQLEELELRLRNALAIYSETNPRVVILRTQIAQLEKSLQEQAPAVPAEDEPQERRPMTALDLTLAELNQRSASKQEELSTVVSELDTLNTSILATAGNAVALNALERDFENIQMRYNEAVANLNQARVNERIEVSAQGERVTVIENASVPQEPSGPKRFRLIAMGIAAGGALAASFFVLLELLNSTIRRPVELQSKFGIIPLAIVPYMESNRQRFLRRCALVGALLAVAISVPAALWYVDTQYMPLDVLTSKVLGRLGWG